MHFFVVVKHPLYGIVFPCAFVFFGGKAGKKAATERMWNEKKRTRSMQFERAQKSKEDIGQWWLQ